MSWAARGQTRTPDLGGGQGAEELTGVAVAADTCGRLGHSAARHRGQRIPCRELPGLVILEMARVLGLMSWADPPGRGSPRGGNPGSWWVGDSWLPRCTGKSLDAREQFSASWAFSASILLFTPPGRTRESLFLSLECLEVLSVV